MAASGKTFRQVDNKRYHVVIHTYSFKIKCRLPPIRNQWEDRVQTAIRGPQHHPAATLLYTKAHKMGIKHQLVWVIPVNNQSRSAPAGSLLICRCVFCLLLVQVQSAKAKTEGQLVLIGFESGIQDDLAGCGAHRGCLYRSFVRTWNH